MDTGVPDKVVYNDVVAQPNVPFDLTPSLSEVSGPEDGIFLAWYMPAYEAAP